MISGFSSWKYLTYRRSFDSPKGRSMLLVQLMCLLCNGKYTVWPKTEQFGLFSVLDSYEKSSSC